MTSWRTACLARSAMSCASVMRRLSSTTTSASACRRCPILVDTDELDRILPVPRDLPCIAEQNLRAVWKTFAAERARRLILTGVWLDRPSELAWSRRAVPRARCTVVRLVASEATLLGRVARREMGSGAEAQAERSLLQLATMERDHQPWAHVVSTDDQDVTEVAHQLIRLWLTSD